MSFAAPRAVLLLLPLGLLGACTDEGGDDKSGTDTGADDTGGDTDTDTDTDTDSGVEPGCITVDGGGGYALISDALAAASDGSTITLCEGTFNEAVTVDKAVTILGAGVDSTTVSAPTNQEPFTITSPGVTLQWMALESTRSGVVVEADDATLTELALLSVANYGVTARDAENLSVDNCVFNAAGYGAVQVEGGSASIAFSTFEDNVGFAIHGLDGAELSIQNNTINGTVATDPSSPIDGHGIWLVESSGVLSDNVLTDNAFVGIFADTGDLSLSGDSVTGSLYGVAALLGAFEADSVTATDNYYHGIFTVTDSTDQVITNSTVSGDPSVVVSVDNADWGDDSVGYLGVGLYVVGPTPVIENTTVTGYNNAGLLLSPYDDTGSDTTLTDVSLVDNGRVALYALSTDVTASNLNVSGVVEVEDAADEQCYSVGGNAGVSIIQGSLSMTGGSIEDNDGYGLASVYSVATLEGVSVAGNSCAGMMNFGGYLVAQGNTISRSHGGSFEAGIVSYQGSNATIIGNTFDGSQEWTLMYSSEYDDGAGNIYRYDQYQYEGADIQLYFGGENTIEENVFNNGTDSVYAYDSDVTVESNTWTDYRGVVLYTASSEGTTMTVKDATVEGFYSYGMYCSSATMDVSDSTFTSGGSYMYSLEAFLNDEPYYSYDSEYANPVMYGYECAATLEDVEVADTNGLLLRTYGGTYDFASVYADSIGAADYSSYAAIYTYGYLDTEVWLTDVSLSNVIVGGGVSMYSYDDLDVALHVDGLSMSDIEGTALTLYRSSTDYPVIEADIEGLSISGAAAGLYAVGGSLTVSDSTISDTTGEGVILDQSTFYAENTTITGAGEDGFLADESDITLTGSTISGSGYSGMYLSSSSATVLSNTITGNGEYGMECSSVTIGDCGNDLSGNTLGEQLNCSESCAVPAD